MSLMKVALIVYASKELTLTAGQREINPSNQDEPEINEEDEILPFLKIGRAEGDDFHVNGPWVDNPDHIGSSLAIGWYFPDEEQSSDARVIDLSEAKIIISTAPRKKADYGWRWQYRLESRPKTLTTNVYNTGFQPPFKASDLTLHLCNTINYNFDGHILTKVEYTHCPPSYIESEWRVPKLESEGFLED